MKKHAIIPIFIPHRGCKNECVFCNQKVITARDGSITPNDARNIIEEYLPTLANRELEIEVSFFGGSFTGIPIEDQSAFLSVAKEYKDKGLVDKIHLSTRPDYIDKGILDNLKKYSVDVIELGVQSFDPKVLLASKRGHTQEAVYRACDLIKEYGFTLGIQLMVGLPMDSYRSCMESVRKTIEIGPSLARIYPTVVISNTRLYDMYMDGTYIPFKEDLMLQTVKDMYKALKGAGITVMRIGLKSTALMNSNSDFVACGYHPAFRQLVEGSIARDEIEEKLKEFIDPVFLNKKKHILIRASNDRLSSVVGHKNENRKYLEEKYPNFKFSFKSDGEEDIALIDITKKTVYICEDAHDEVIEYIQDNLHKVIKVRPHADVDCCISKHPDVYMCNLGDSLFVGDASKLSKEYPGDVLFNAARVGKYFICSKYTDEDLKNKAKEKGLTLINVPQGYVKCNLAVIDDTHVITEDEGIAKALENTDLKVLLISKGYVALPGYKYGFIGGSCGSVGNTIIFNGDISNHPDFDRINEFIKDAGKNIASFDFPLTDIGSIIEV